MEIRGEIRAQFALTPEEAAELLLAIGKTSAPASARTESETVKTECGAKDSAPGPAHTTRTEAAGVKAECGAKDSAPEPAHTTQTETPTQEQTQGQEQEQEPADAETPERAVSLLRQQFGIPAVKEDRDEEQQRRSMELNRAVMAMIREITRNNSARSLADLKSDMEKQEFIRRSLTLTYDGQKFEEIPF